MQSKLSFTVQFYARRRQDSGLLLSYICFRNAQHARRSAIGPWLGHVVKLIPAPGSRVPIPNKLLIRTPPLADSKAPASAISRSLLTPLLHRLQSNHTSTETLLCVRVRSFRLHGRSAFFQLRQRLRNAWTLLRLKPTLWNYVPFLRVNALSGLLIHCTLISQPQLRMLPIPLIQRGGTVD